MSDFVELFLLLKQRDCHVGENPGIFFKMVLFLMFFPGFGGKGCIFTVDVSASNGSVSNDRVHTG